MASSVSIVQIVAAHRHREGPLLPILHDVQAAFGYISEDSIRTISYELNLTRAEVFGVVSFYHDFKQKPGAPKLKLCRAEACQARGIEALVNQIDLEKIEAVYCLGLCSVGPAALTPDGHVHAQLDVAKLKALIA